MSYICLIKAFRHILNFVAVGIILLHSMIAHCHRDHQNTVYLQEAKSEVNWLFESILAIDLGGDHLEIYDVNDGDLDDWQFDDNESSESYYSTSLNAIIDNKYQGDKVADYQGQLAFNKYHLSFNLGYHDSHLRRGPPFLN